jgi:2-hydroxychromene-2-carboxylate isomerase
MKPPIDYFDFVALRLPRIAEDRKPGLAWEASTGIRSCLAVFRQRGTSADRGTAKGDYCDDFERSAFTVCRNSMPSRFPIPSQAPARIVLWQKMQDPAMPARLVKAYFHAFFADDIDISGPDNAVAVAAKEGIDAAAARAAIDDPAIKDALKREVDGAIARGVFGSPFVIVDDERRSGASIVGNREMVTRRGF